MVVNVKYHEASKRITLTIGDVTLAIGEPEADALAKQLADMGYGEAELESLVDAWR